MKLIHYVLGIILILLASSFWVTPATAVDETTFRERYLDRFFDWATAVGTIGAVGVALLIAEKQSRETLAITEKQSKENIILQMKERLFELIAAIRVNGSDSGIETLKEIWFRFECKDKTTGERTPYWNIIEKYESDDSANKIMANFYQNNLRKGVIFGDFETLNYYYLSMFPICPEGLLNSLKKLHPRELGFLAFTICVVRNDKEAASTIVEYGILDRAIEQGVMPPTAQSIVEKIAKGEFLKA